MWLKQQSPSVLISSCLCSSIFQIQKGLPAQISNSLDCCYATSTLTLFFRSLNVTAIRYYTKPLALPFTHLCLLNNKYSHHIVWFRCHIYYWVLVNIFLLYCIHHWSLCVYDEYHVVLNIHGQVHELLEIQACQDYL